ncbi:MAG: hypothetical protein NVS2B14_00610 [Chamaesiphon sp.]
MATKNPRVAAYIDPEDHGKLRAFMEEYGVSESRAIALILKNYFDGTPITTETSRISEALSSTLSSSADVVLLERITLLEEKIEALSNIPSSSPSKIEAMESRLRAVEVELGESAA